VPGLNMQTFACVTWRRWSDSCRPPFLNFEFVAKGRIMTADDGRMLAPMRPTLR
jgi:hypothetical protein